MNRIRIGVPREILPGERRVALVPALVPKLVTAGGDVHVQAGAGVAAGFQDQRYADKGAHIADEVLRHADVVLKVRCLTAEEISKVRDGAILIALLDPFTNSQIPFLATRGITAFAMELMPRIARAQPMDALSAMSTVAGYKAVILAADHHQKFFPLLMTAAGTVPPARVLVIGAGVAGLQAIGTAKRLGAVVEAYDTRPAVKEQVQSVGAKFLELELDAADSEETGGYARAQDQDFYKKQQELMTKHVAGADVVITAALVWGRQAPVLITEEMVRTMKPGSVIVDLASEQGGNCALTSPGEHIVKHDVTIIGPLNIASSMALPASEMYARTVTNFFMSLVHDGTLQIDPTDELVRAALVTHRGEIVNPQLGGRQSP